MKCYLIVAPSGSYDSYYENKLHVFLSKEKALNYIEKYNRILSKATDHYKNYTEIYESFEDSSKHENWDGWCAVIRDTDIQEMKPAFIHFLFWKSVLIYFQSDFLL